MIRQCAIYALHGFLGSPASWHGLLTTSYLQQITSRLQAENLFQDYPIASLSDAAALLNHKAQQDKGKRILIGYSLGGRIALHALLQQPDLWSAAVLISTHLGLKSEEEKQKRAVHDEMWAVRFEKDPWQQVVNAWNQQPVFFGDSTPKANKGSFSREVLALALRKWSLATQNALDIPLAKIDCPVLWVAGENDHFYVEQARNIKLKHPLSRIMIIPSASHRAHLQQQELFLEGLKSFLSIISV